MKRFPCYATILLVSVRGCYRVGVSWELTISPNVLSLSTVDNNVIQLISVLSPEDVEVSRKQLQSTSILNY
jgi:hypothetical protein